MLAQAPHDDRWTCHDEKRSIAWWIGLLAGWLGFTSEGFAAERYIALFEDGVRVHAAEIKDWNDPQSQPRVGERLLWEPSRPLRWVIDRQLWRPVLPQAYVEFVGGDRLPGEVVASQTGDEWPFESLTPHLVVRPVADLQPPDETDRGLLRVAVEAVQRVVWIHRAAEGLRPATAFLLNGGELSFRSLRWQSSSVVLLLEEGVKEVPFSDLAEIHLPQRDPWQAYLDELAVLGSDPPQRIIEWHTVDGGRYTASTARHQARHWGDKNRPEAWLHLIQPAWALDPLWLRFRTVHTVRSWAAHEPPLVRFGPQAIRRQAVFSQGWNWQRDQSPQGRLLQIGTTEFASGYGVHASTDLEFVWPPFAQGLRVMVGLDPAAGQRGCVDVSILVDERVLFQRERLVGSQEVLDSSWLALTGEPTEGQQRLILRADMAAAQHPAGADPFDIRDMVTWGDPQVRIDPEVLKPAGRRLLAHMGALRGWTVSDADAATLRTLTVCDTTDPREPRFRTVFRTVEPLLILSRSLRVKPSDQWFSLVLSRFSDHAPTWVQVRLDGISRGEFEIPVRQGPIDPDPIVIPVGDCRGRTVPVELVFYPTAEHSWVDWRGVSLTEVRPGIRPLVVDELSGLELPIHQEDRWQWSDQQPFSGLYCLRVAPGPPLTLPISPGGEAVLTEWPKLGQFRYLTFAWRGDHTSGLALLLGYEGRFGAEIAEALVARGGNRPARRLGRGRKMEDRGLRHGYAYDAGSYQPLDLSPLRLDRQVPDQWKLETRDVFSDFGPVTLTGVGLQTLERGTGWFDHIYLARTPQDVEYIRRLAAPPPSGGADEVYVRKAQHPEEWGAAVAQFAPMFATREAPHGLLLKREHFGQTDGWQTYPIDQHKPFVLRAGLVLPEAIPQELDLRVSHAPEGDWRLVVRVNGQRIFEKIIDDQLTRPQRGWASLQVDLSPYRGQKVLLEVWNESNDGKSDAAFWKRVVLRERSASN